MAIKSDQVLLKEGGYGLGKRADAPTAVQNLRDDAYSLHHVLPYRYPLFVGFLAEKYRTTFVPQASRGDWPTALTYNDPVGPKVAKVLKVVSRFGANQHDLPSKFAWMGPNLFQGPAGNLRTDDPGSGRETIRPCSMKQKLWDNLMRLGDKIEALGVSFPSDGVGSRAKTTYDLKVSHFDELLQLMNPITKTGHGNALTFDAEDWIIPISVSNDPRYRLQPNAAVNDDFKRQFLLYAAANPQNIQLYKPLPSFGHQITVLWRLRKPNEPVPNQTCGAPRLQPLPAS